MDEKRGQVIRMTGIDGSGGLVASHGRRDCGGATTECGVDA